MRSSHPPSSPARDSRGPTRGGRPRLGARAGADLVGAHPGDTGVADAGVADVGGVDLAGLHARLAGLEGLDEAGLGALLCAAVAGLGDAGQRVAVARAAVGDLGDPCDTHGLVAVAAAAAGRVHGGHRAKLAADLVAGLWPADAADATLAAVDTLGATERVRVTERAFVGLTGAVRAGVARDAARGLDPDLTEALTWDRMGVLDPARRARVACDTIREHGLDQDGLAEVARTALARLDPHRRAAVVGDPIGRLDPAGLAEVARTALARLDPHRRAAVVGDPIGRLDPAGLAEVAGTGGTPAGAEAGAHAGAADVAGAQAGAHAGAADVAGAQAGAHAGAADVAGAQAGSHAGAQAGAADAGGFDLGGLDAAGLAGLAARVVGRLDAAGLVGVVGQAVGGLAGDGDGLIGAGRAVVGALGADALAPGAVGDEALAATVTGLDRLERMVHGEKLRRISALDERGAHQGKARSTADWLAPALGLSPAEAKAHTDTAKAMARLPQAARRLREGELGVGQAQQAARSLAELDRTADTDDATAEPAAVARLDGHVAAAGPTQTRQQLRNGIDELHHDHDPDVLAHRQRRARARRNAWIATGPDGDIRFGGNLDPLAGAHLAAALAALARPSDRTDQRTPGQRRADAFTDLARRALDHDDLPEMAAHHPHVIVVTTNAALDAAPDADASWLDGYGPVSSATARMLACHGQVTEVVVDAHGRPLKVIENGRPTRAQRRAVIARDGGCIGCGAPAAHCQLHHIVYRRRGGATIVANLVLVCWILWSGGEVEVVDLGVCVEDMSSTGAGVQLQGPMERVSRARRPVLSARCSPRRAAMSSRAF